MALYNMASMGVDGSLWALDSGNTALRFLGDGAQQAEPSQSLVSLAVVNASTIYGLDAAGSLWRLTDTPMTSPVWSSPDVWKVAIARDGSTWCIMQTGGGVHEWANGSWQPRPSGGFSILFLAVGNGNVVWSIDNKSGWWGGGGPALRWNGSNFVVVPGAPTNTQWISIAPDDGTVYLQTSNSGGGGSTLKYQNGTFTTLATNTPTLFSIAAGPSGVLYGSTLDGGLWVLAGGAWRGTSLNIPAGMDFSATTDGTLCTMGGRLAGFNIWTPIDVPNAGLDAIAIDAHQMYFEQLGGGYVKWGGSQWTQIASGTMRSISAGSDGTLWGVDQTNKVYSWNGASWTLQNGTMQKVAVGSAQYIAGLDPSGNVFYLDNGSWTRIASPTTGAMIDVAIGNDATMAALDSSRTLWTRIAPGDWTRRSLQLTQIDVADRYHMCGATPASRGSNIVWQGAGRMLNSRVFLGREGEERPTDWMPR